MWRTIKYSMTGKPLIDVNEQGVFYSYLTRQLKQLKYQKRNTTQYAYWTDDGKNHYAHREVAKAFPEICGEWFDGCEVHHKDGNPLNNEASNLIVCTKEEHIAFHRMMKAKRVIHKDERPFEEKLKEFRKGGKYKVCYYCRNSKVNALGLAPIEISITQQRKRFFHNTGFYCNPKEFKKGNYPEGFSEFLQTIY